MALLDQRSRNRDEVTGHDVATRALSGTAVEHDFVTRVYEKLASVYDLTFGPGLHPGRVCSFQKLQFAPGERLLEVGVGTGIKILSCSVSVRSPHSLTELPPEVKPADKAR